MSREKNGSCERILAAMNAGASTARDIATALGLDENHTAANLSYLNARARFVEVCGSEQGRGRPRYHYRLTAAGRAQLQRRIGEARSLLEATGFEVRP